MRLIFFLLFLFSPFLSYAEVTTPTNLFNASYSVLFSPDKQNYSEGLFFSYDMANKRTRITGGFHHSYYKIKKSSKIAPIKVSFAGSVTKIPFLVNLNIDDITYESKRTGDIYELSLFGEYNYFRQWWRIKKFSHALSLFVGAGIKTDLTVEDTTYSFYIDGKKFDSINNPISKAKSSGVKFFISHTIGYRFSQAQVGITTSLSIPDWGMSFIGFQAGFAL